MEQVLYKVYFNLRERKTNKPTSIICKVYISGKQYKFATGVKVLSKQWDNKRQIAIISNVQSKLDNYNNRIANDKINEMKLAFDNFLEYLCETNKFNVYTLKTYMNKKAIKTAKDLMIEGYNYFYAPNTPKYKHLKSDLNAFIKYLDANNITKLDAFTQSGFNSYKKYLMDIGTSNVMTNKHCVLVQRIINKVLSIETPFKDYGIKEVKYNKIKDDRPNKGRESLTKEEVEIIENLVIDENGNFSFIDVAPKDENGEVNNKYRTSKTGKILKQYRDIFVLQCRCGQRVSDLVQFLTGQYEIITEGNYTYYKIRTKKSQKKIESFIQKDTYTSDFLEKYKSGFDINIKSLDTANSYYNLAIKKVCKLCNINRIITYIDAKQVEHKDECYKVVTSHWARHTFITHKIQEGYSAERLCYLTGHRDDKMINEIYTHLNSNDKVKLLIEEENKIKDNKKTIEAVKKKASVLQALFAYDSLKQLETMKKTGIDILPLSNQCIAIIKETNKLDKAIHLFELSPKEKQKEFIDKVKELDKIIWYIGKHTADTSLYSIYEYKCKCFSIIDKITDIDLLNNIWQQELLNEEEEYYSDDNIIKRNIKIQFHKNNF